mgnify:CR=1 FL=1
MFLLLLLIPFSYSQVRLETIDVEAPGPLLQQVSTPVWHASEATMQESVQVQDVLQQAPGVVTTQAGGVGGQGAIFLRGSESRHTLVLTDGMRLNDPSNTDRNFDTAFQFSPFFQDVLLLQGPSPVLYGGDATSGVIELIPCRGHTLHESTLSLAAGSFDSVRGFGLLDWGGNDHQGTFGLMHLKTQGFSRLSRKRYGATESDGAESTQLMQASRHRWNTNLQTDLLLYGIVAQAQQDDTTVGDTNDHTNNQQGTIVQTTRGKFAAGDWWLKTGVVSHRRELHIASFGDPIYLGQTRDARAGVRIQSGPFETLAGLGGEQEWLSTDDFKANNDLGHVFALQRYLAGSWLFEVGARGEHHQRYGNFLVHELSAKHELTSELSWYAKQARGYKSPSLFHLYAPGFFGGNPGLTPEFNNSMELGVAWKREGEMSLVAFQQDFKNLIQYDTTDGYFNGGALRVRGTEATVLSPEHSWGQIKLSGSWFDYSHYDTAPLRRPPYLGSLLWLGQWGNWGTELGARWLGGRKDTSNHKMEAFEVLSGAIKFSPDEHQQWSLRAGNLTDREYEEVWGYTVAPINLALQWIGRY